MSGYLWRRAGTAWVREDGLAEVSDEEARTAGSPGKAWERRQAGTPPIELRDEPLPTRSRGA